MPIPDEAKAVHGRWSEVNRTFLEFVERDSASRDPASFASLDEAGAALQQPIQPWPLFMGPEQRREVAALTLGIDRLVKATVRRLLQDDPERVVDFYRTQTPEGGTPPDFVLTEDMLALIAWEPDGISGAPSRADYIETADGLKCIEYNAGGFLGGLQTEAIGALYLGCEPIARFLRERGLTARSPAVLPALFAHVVEDTVRLGVWTGGDFTCAMVVRPHHAGWLAKHSAEDYTRQLHRAMEENGLPPRGRVLLCSLDELRQEGGGITLEGHRVHAVVEQHNGEGDLAPAFRAFKMGSVNLFSGPIGEILSDKRNVALLSEQADSGEFTAEERALVERHVPWTRRLLPGETRWRGAPLRIPQDVAERRDEFVLKKAGSLGGESVEVGRFRTDEAWRRALEMALREEDWVVQEYLATVPYWFPTGDGRVAPHEMVWGLFAFGDRYGGAFLRMSEAGTGDGVVNTKRGSSVGAVLEIDE